MMGDFAGGALMLADGRRFTEKWKWYQYDGAKVAHGVEPFEGERLSVVLYTLARRWKVYTLEGSAPVPDQPEEHPQPAQHPMVEQMESPRTMQAREATLKVQAAKAQLEWRQTAASRLWNLIKAPLEVYRHSGEALLEDPRLTKEYKAAVLKGLRLEPIGAE